MKERFLVSNVKDDTIIIITYEKKAARIGDMTHDNRIKLNLDQLSLSIPVPIIPAPSSEPITVCVPDIGIENKDDVIMKMKEARHTPNIILSISQYSRVKMLGIT